VEEFRNLAFKGNVVELAVAAFGPLLDRRALGGGYSKEIRGSTTA
jgi:hypothetical protein